MHQFAFFIARNGSYLTKLSIRGNNAALKDILQKVGYHLWEVRAPSRGTNPLVLSNACFKLDRKIFEMAVCKVPLPRISGLF
jgi:hypothetical protein